MGSLNTPLLLTVVALVLSEYIPDVTASIKCYKCMVATPVIYYENDTVQLCKHFDYSDKFLVDCPYSTFCMKKTVSAKIPYVVNGVERDCASQKRKNHVYVNNQWQVQYVVEDPYEEGCRGLDDKGARTTTTEFCYCKGDGCNSARALGGRPLLSILFAVIALLSTPYLCRAVL